MLATNLPPQTIIDPVIDTLHGTSIADPYRWLEDSRSAQTRRWLAEQNAYARAYLDSVPGRERIRRRVEQLLAVEVRMDPWKVGDRYFYLKRRASQEQPSIMMSDGSSGDEVLLVDPAVRDEGNVTAVSIIHVSRDGNILAYGVKHDGMDSQSVEFLNVKHKQILPDRLPTGFGPELLFSPDGRGFYYAHEITHSNGPRKRAVYWHLFGQQASQDLEIFTAGHEQHVHVGVFGSTDGALLGFVVYESGDPKTIHIYVQPMGRGSGAKKILATHSLFCPFFMGHTLVALTDCGAPNLRVVTIDPDHAEAEYWRDLVPQRPQRIDSVSTIGTDVYVSYIDGTSSRIESFGLKDRRQVLIPCPPHGAARLFRRPPDTDTLFYEFSAFDRAPMIYSYRPNCDELKIWARPAIVFDSSSLKLRQIKYKSKDGIEVPMYLIGSKQRWRGPMPTLLTGYGGFGYTHTPQFKASYAFLVERGFLLAIANVRGGGELGEEWHLAGQRRNRQTSFDDFLSAAEWLVHNGYTTTSKLAISGGSNAGLLVAAALTQRPGLFRAVVCSGPLLDMLRYHYFDYAEGWIEEYGCADNSNDFPHLLAYSPYHHVENGVPYPSVMLVSGDADSRCNPMHARKMTARLQAATGSNYPILLSYRPEWGHMPVMPLGLRIEALTDRLAFICHELDIDI
jgi:prolyl oligopeptidase